MKMKMRATGVGQVVSNLRYNAVKVPDAARKAMHRGAERIQKEAKLNAPVDDAELEDSIHLVKTYEDRRRLTIAVVAGGVVRGVDVDRYVVIVHENYEGMLKDGPGPNTLLKMKANPGRKIGSKFLQRAQQAERRRLKKNVIEGITKVMIT